MQCRVWTRNLKLRYDQGHFVASMSASQMLLKRGDMWHIWATWPSDEITVVQFFTCVCHSNLKLIEWGSWFFPNCIRLDLMEQSLLSVAGAGSCIHQGVTSLGSQIWAKQEKLQTNHHETHRYHKWHRSCQFTSNKWNFKKTKPCHPKLFSEVTWWQKRRRPVMEPGLTAVTSLGMIRTVERLSLRQFLAADGAYLMTLHWGMIYCKKNHGLWRSKKKHMHCSRLVRSR